MAEHQIDMSDCECCGGGGCTGSCTFMWTGTDWAPIANTCSVGCTCAQPAAPGTTIGEMQTVDCFPE